MDGLILLDIYTRIRLNIRGGLLNLIQEIKILDGEQSLQPFFGAMAFLNICKNSGIQLLSDKKLALMNTAESFRPYLEQELTFLLSV